MSNTDPMTRSELAKLLLKDLTKLNDPVKIEFTSERYEPEYGWDDVTETLSIVGTKTEKMDLTLLAE